MALPLPQSSRIINKPSLWLSLFLLSSATLAFEINLTRLFSVSQFYHFAFMIISVALLGYGASGSFLTIFPAIRRLDPLRSLTWLSLAASCSILVAYLLTNWLPFDSYSLLVDKKQVFILILHYIALSAPFFFSGMALAKLLSDFPDQTGSIYATNLFGSAAGCIFALLAPPLLSGEGMITLSSLLAGLAALVAIVTIHPPPYKNPAILLIFGLLVFNSLDLGLRSAGQKGLSWLEIRISPYKSLSYALQVPGSEVIYQRWNAFSRIDVVRSSGIHSVPGLSYRYLEPLPSIDGLLVDGDDLNPIVSPSTNPGFTAYLPVAIAFDLRPHASTLILESRGGLDIFTALSLSTGRVSSTEFNPLIITAAPVYADQHVFVHQETERSFLQRTQEQFDVIVLSLTSSFHPVQSGAYSLGEDYRYTVEAFQDILAHLTPGGFLVAMRWLQDPPSEDLRLFALSITAIEKSGGDPREQIVAFRGYNTASVLIKNGAFTTDELQKIRQFTSQRAFDLTYAPDIQASETNLYNILPDSTYYNTYLKLLDSHPRQAFYDAYPYDVQPPTDDHPFFGHYFKWSQTSQILAAFGKAWLPFGGGGYFVILAFLGLAVFFAGLLILVPVGIWRLYRRKSPRHVSPFILRNLVYFGLLGLAFMFVEIPLIQRFILYLGNPAYAFTTVLFSLLLFSGIGSRWSRRISLRYALAGLTFLVLVFPFLLPPLFTLTLGFSLPARLGATIIVLSPLGFLMGIPFPAGIRQFTRHLTPDSEDNNSAISDIPWIWAINGAASVISPIMAALLALTFGFSAVLWLGGLGYAFALITVWLSLRRSAVRSLLP